MFRKGAPFVAGVLLLLACSSKSEKEENLSPSMQAALRALGDLPLREIHAGLDGGFSYDAGVNIPRENETENFGNTDTGANIISGVGKSGPTGNGPGNGGVGIGSGPGNGGIGLGSGENGVAQAPSVGNGGVSAGSADGANQLAAVVCEFLNAFCASFAKCELGKVDLDECNFDQPKCTAFVNEIVSRSSQPITIPPGALSGMRCISKALRGSCILSESGARAFESQVRACGLPLQSEDREEVDDEDTRPPTTGSASSP